ncbi:hypothetical protein [Actinoplanes teichomyceticus]|uniref:Uncharacterized protein n=1 Tax=Actinoplanes teichomyceticus TaxID=1867 RepID=A0A561VGN6_ACTTI|nr:hypothetical protein [Actinoplanes teichomyceticus]TWG10773.1 hypothetical protein FHX34_107269 [Actinoplanes teichomyceticus]
MQWMEVVSILGGRPGAPAKMITKWVMAQVMDLLIMPCVVMFAESSPVGNSSGVQ